MLEQNQNVCKRNGHEHNLYHYYLVVERVVRRPVRTIAGLTSLTHRSIWWDLIVLDVHQTEQTQYTFSSWSGLRHLELGRKIMEYFATTSVDNFGWSLILYADVSSKTFIMNGDTCEQEQCNHMTKWQQENLVGWQPFWGFCASFLLTGDTLLWFPLECQ